jgi:hypothetical protein
MKGNSRVPLPLIRLLRGVTIAAVTWAYQPILTISFMTLDGGFQGEKPMTDAFPGMYIILFLF